jgi:hypothetical protein
MNYIINNQKLSKYLQSLIIQNIILKGIKLQEEPWQECQCRYQQYWYFG